LQNRSNDVAKTQTLSFPIRLPDVRQAEALRMLDASRLAINEILTDLWPQLDRFAVDRTGPACKQVERHLIKRSGHGSRQARGEMEQAGRILRAQASRKQVFQALLPLLSEGLIRPADGKRPARKDHSRIKEQVRALRAQMHDAGEEACEDGEQESVASWLMVVSSPAPLLHRSCFWIRQAGRSQQMIPGRELQERLHRRLDVKHPPVGPESRCEDFSQIFEHMPAIKHAVRAWGAPLVAPLR
jgi:hypothetical protein